MIWFWDIGTPGWIQAERGRERSRIRIAGRDHHGFFLVKDREGFSAQICLDPPARRGESVEMAFRTGAAIALPAQAPYRAAGQRESAAARQLQEDGFVRVGAAGRGFTTANGAPFYPFGNNQPYLITLSSEEQNRILQRMADSGMNTVRVLISDCWFAPLPGVWNEEAYRRLHRTVAHCRAHGIRVIACQEQSNRPAHDFFAYANALLADSLIARARMVRRADPKHPITLSHGNPRLLRGRAGDQVYDYWSPHTYDLWINGPEISHHALLLVESLRRALPGRPRPVVIEEFGISEGADFPEAMRAEHIRQFIEAARHRGAGSLLHWWEMTPLMYRIYVDASPYRPRPTARLSPFIFPSGKSGI
ncbi:MAG: cellulase family glycosylhydrolase [Armatimonadetes bacterium]|nr:cellulase family glycosylhydrolase [Armatimonadota bacterium]